MTEASILATRAPPSAPGEDHRVRVGRERRERMRAHLLCSVLAVCSAETRRGPAVIDDVVKHAEVARGTFYKYFDSLDQAIAELGLQLAVEMADGALSVYEELDDPMLRTATGFQLFLIRATIEPAWGAFIAHIGLLSGDNPLTRKIRGDLRRGVETGAYSVPSVDVACDLLMGAKIEAIRRLLIDGGSTLYIRAMAAMVLRSFGVPQAKAERTAAAAFDRLSEEAPVKIGWWKRID